MPQLITSEIVIDAPPSAVWSVLIQAEAWPLWTRALALESGDFVKGGRPTLRQADGRTFSPRITAMVPARRLQWRTRAGLPGLLDAKRDFVLTEREDLRTHLQQTIRYSGLFSSVLTLAPQMLAPDRCEDLNAEVKARAEETGGGDFTLEKRGQTLNDP